MNVKELKELLKDVPDDTPVVIPVKQYFDGAFYSPCIEDSGVGELGLYFDEEEEKEAALLGKPTHENSFMLLPHGFFEEPDYSHELN